MTSDTSRLLDDLLKGRRSRRDLVKGAAALGLSAAAIADLVAAADARGAASAQTPATQAEGGTGVESGLLRVPELNPTRGGTLRTAFGVTTTSYDIWQGGTPHVLTHMYNGLIRQNPFDGLQTIIPDLAESWEVSGDGLAYTFRLRQGVAFHDGTPFTSADVVATYSRVISPPTGVISVMKPFFRSVERVEAVDEVTVTFVLREPQADLLQALAAPFNCIYPKQALDANNQDLRTVVVPGTGPFVFGEYRDAERWVLTKNPTYWNPELPYVDGLELIHVAAWSDRGTAILTGQADLSWNVSRETFDQGERAADVARSEVPSVGCYTVIMNTQREPFNDPRVRRAMHLAISRQNLIQAFRTQETIALSRWVSHASALAMPPEQIATLAGYREDKSEDIATAKQLLAEAGHPDGISGIELLSASVPPHAEIMAPAIQDQLKQALNIDAQIRVTERAQLVEEESSGNFDLVLDTPTISIADFSAVGNLYFRSGAAQNFGKYANPQFDELLHAVDQELDQERRAATLRQIEDVLDQDPPWLLVGWTFHLPMWQTAVKGLNLEVRTESVWGRVDTAYLDR
jgi:peptide/nickel transport system substrate-binding protein